MGVLFHTLANMGEEALDKSSHGPQQQTAVVPVMTV